MFVNIISKLLTTLILLFIFKLGYGQEEYIEFKQPINFFILPKKINESSGLIFYNGLLWSFNDSGGKPVLYGFNKNNGEIITKIKLKKGKNFDWEDITQDEEHIYIGDFGNNFGNRKNLRIFIIDKDKIDISTKNTIDYETIFFNYQEQTSFKPTLGQTAYDCESLINTNKELIIFTKNWKNKSSVVYAIPKNAGKYCVKKLHSIKINGLITGAESIGNNKIIVCGRNKIAPFIAIMNIQKYSILKFISFPLLKNYQIEGITIDNQFVYLSSEETVYSPRVFKIELDKIIN